MRKISLKDGKFKKIDRCHNCYIHRIISPEFTGEGNVVCQETGKTIDTNTYLYGIHKDCPLQEWGEWQWKSTKDELP